MHKKTLRNSRVLDIAILRHFVYIIISENYYADSYQHFQQSFQHGNQVEYQAILPICQQFQKPEVDFCYKSETKYCLHNAMFSERLKFPAPDDDVVE